MLFARTYIIHLFIFSFLFTACLDSESKDEPTITRAATAPIVGNTGAMGPPGEKGDKGDKGEKGDKGDPGASGSFGQAEVTVQGPLTSGQKYQNNRDDPIYVSVAINVYCASSCINQLGFVRMARIGTANFIELGRMQINYTGDSPFYETDRFGFFLPAGWEYEFVRQASPTIMSATAIHTVFN